MMTNGLKWTTTI